MICLALVIPGILQVTELEATGCDLLEQRRGGRADARCLQDRPTDLRAILLPHLLGHLLCRMLGYCMGNLMTEHDSKGCFVLGHGEQAFVHDDLTARHTERVYVLVLDKVELPIEVLALRGHPVVLQVSLHRIRQACPYPSHHGRIRSIGGRLGRLHVFRILLVAQAQDLFV